MQHSRASSDLAEPRYERLDDGLIDFAGHVAFEQGEHGPRFVGVPERSVDGDRADDDFLAGVVLSDLLLEAGKLLFGLGDFLFERECHSPPLPMREAWLFTWDQPWGKVMKCAVIQTAKLFVRGPSGALPRRTTPPSRRVLPADARAAHPGPGQRHGAGPR